jgi:small subunit ribosomal protein S6
MLILNPEVEVERQDDIVERVRQLITGGGGEISHVDDWGRRKIAFPMRKQPDGRYVVVTCDTTPSTVDEVGRVLAINKDVVLRAVPIRLSPAQAERARTHGSPMPVDDRPEGESRGGGRPGRGGRGRRPR